MTPLDRDAAIFAALAAAHLAIPAEDRQAAADVLRPYFAAALQQPRAVNLEISSLPHPPKIDHHDY